MPKMTRFRSFTSWCSTRTSSLDKEEEEGGEGLERDRTKESALRSGCDGASQERGLKDLYSARYLVLLPSRECALLRSSSLSPGF